MSLILNRRGFALGASALALAACNRQSGGSGEEEKVVNVYSARHYDSDRRFYAAFTEATGVEVQVLQAPGEQLLERLRAEGDQTAADLIVAADAGNLWRLKDAGLTQNVTSPALEAGVPANLRDPEGAWWSFSKRARVIIYRKDAVEAAQVQSMDDVANPRFRGQVVMRSSSNVYNLSMLAGRIEKFGSENARAWAQGVRNNFARDPQGADSDQIKAVAAGEAKVTIVNHYYYVRQATSEDPAVKAAAERCGLIFPDQAGVGTPINISGGAVSKYAKHKGRAVQLLEFLVSDEAQRLLAPVNVEFPIRPDIAPAPMLQAYGTFKEEDIPLDALGRHQAEAAQIYEAVGWR